MCSAENDDYYGWSILLFSHCLVPVVIFALGGRAILRRVNLNEANFTFTHHDRDPVRKQKENYARRTEKHFHRRRASGSRSHTSDDELFDLTADAARGKKIHDQPARSGDLVVQVGSSGKHELFCRQYTFVANDAALRAGLRSCISPPRNVVPQCPAYPEQVRCGVLY